MTRDMCGEEIDEIDDPNWGNCRRCGDNLCGACANVRGTWNDRGECGICDGYRR